MSSKALTRILAYTKPTYFYATSQKNFTQLDNFVTICMSPPLCTFTSKAYFPLESLCEIIYTESSNVDTLKESQSSNNTSQLIGRIFHIKALHSVYFYIVEIKDLGLSIK